MISPTMFDEFVKPELEATCQKLSRTIYHLDGVGELAHLDSILSIKELDAVQWLPGAGKPNQSNWPEVYQKIYRSGKKIQVWDGLDSLDRVIEQIGTCKGIHHTHIHKKIGEEQEMLRRIAQYGV